MSPKNVALFAAAAAVMGMGLYLFVQVNATPAQARATATPAPLPARPSPRAELRPEPEPRPAHTAAARSRTPIASPPIHVMADEPPQLTPAETHPNLRRDNMMELANKAYDRQDFDEAIAIAGKVLSKDPGNVRMLRIMVSANCIAGDSGIAQQYYEKLPDFDRGQMRARCDRYGVTFEEPAR